MAKDWVVLADIGQTKLTFPLFITVTLERPDIICYSLSTKHLLSIELTSPCEENMPERHSFKKERYKELKKQVLDAGWSANFFGSPDVFRLGKEPINSLSFVRSS